MSSPLQNSSGVVETEQLSTASNTLTLSPCWENCAKTLENFRLIQSDTVVNNLRSSNYGPPNCDVKKYKEFNDPSKRFECEVCKKRFKHLSARYNHMRTHYDVAPFKCTVCERSFKWKHSLKKHMITHQRKNEITIDQWNENLTVRTYLSAVRNTTTLGKNTNLELFNLETEEQQQNLLPGSQINAIGPLQQAFVQDQTSQNNFTQFHSEVSEAHSNHRESFMPYELVGQNFAIAPVGIENGTSNSLPPVDCLTFSPCSSSMSPNMNYGIQRVSATSMPEHYQYDGFQQQVDTHTSQPAETNYFSNFDSVLIDQQFSHESISEQQESMDDNNINFE